ncbi:MAG TPA: aminodeoxychorismate synthase component I [Terrimesophilobacter sp.]|nr:aminodeoxychorismate synthase component I [Terrimesophilobacter sp.]HRP99082.1 aminodeoxychorismate synthase component I [Terrimesophilobacter sp.]
MRRRVLVHRVENWVDPAAVFTELVADASGGFWLDSGIDSATGVSYLGTSERWVTASIEHGTVTEHPSGTTTLGTIFDTVSASLSEPLDVEPDGADDLTGAFHLGWVGWFGYELHQQTMATGLGQRSKHPDAALAWVDRVIVFDHAARAIRLLALGSAWEGDIAVWRDDTLAALERLPARLPARRSSDDAKPQGTRTALWADTDAEYLSKIRACQEAIRDGDAYQLCLTTRCSIEGEFDAASVYLDLRESSPTHHGAYLRIGEVCLLSASPEQFLSISPGRVIESKPIKGTRPRGRTTAEDEALHEELLASDKERAENLMIVDLMRNDLGRVCEVGSVSVPSLLAVESYAHVHQLVSTVRGELRTDVTVMDAVASCFPAGSMTGAPKHSAVTILDSLEQRPRGIYSGAFGYVSLDGRVDLAMVIRSIVIDADGATIGAGGGITALSVPEEELAEAKLKAAALLAVLQIPLVE